MYYFGCVGDAGHFLWDHLGNRLSHSAADRLLSFKFTILDACLLSPNAPQTEGLAAVAHIGGWSILSFWDRSVDSRPGSNSSFLMPGTWDYETMSAEAKRRFPDIWNRFNFEVTCGIDAK